MRLTWLLLSSLLGAQTIASTHPPTHTTIPAGQVSGTARADTIVGLSPFGGPHITVHNGSAYEWWYFDVVSHNFSAAIVMQFYPAWFPDSNAILLNIVGVPNKDTVIRERIPAGALEISTVGDGSQGYVKDGAMTWFGAPDLSVYNLTLDVDVEGVSIKGTVSMHATAPAHVECGLTKYGNLFTRSDVISWANAVPDAAAMVDLMVDGVGYSFEGSGYHDQNWGLRPFTDDLTQWYWGHFTAGRYSVVYGYYWDASLNISSSIYLADEGTPLVYGCRDGLVQVTARGPGISVPVVELEDVEGWDVVIDDPVEGRFSFFIENTITTVRGDPTVTRFVGRVTGGRTGEANSTGPALVELMSNPRLNSASSERLS
ncbi:hypothetical protein BDW69DRAFT_143372 [Aspergillus filifer]